MWHDEDMRLLLLRRLATLALLALLPGCAWVQTLVLKSIPSRSVLEPLNQGSAHTKAPPFPSLEQEMGNIFSTALVDAYWDQATALAVLQPEAARQHVASAVLCAINAPQHEQEDACVRELSSQLGLPAAPAVTGLTEAAWKREQDVQRVQQNLREALHAAAAYYQSTRQSRLRPQEEPELRAGVARGLTEGLAHQLNRKVARSRQRPVSTFVISGGSANGAFSAGAVWWLLSRLDECKSSGGCEQDRLDIVAGTSTGALISVLLKDYFSDSENRRQRALGMLVDSYTCSVNSDLYCLPQASVYDLVQGTTRGLVRFDGVQSKLERFVDDTTYRSPTEYVACAVDFNSGRIFHFSSSNALDIPDTQALRYAALSSIVQPAMAEPVDAVGSVQGTLIDGGIRSGLPMLTPLLSGAERALVFTNGPLEGRPLPEPPPNAGSIALRMIDLFALQPIVGELHEAENRLAVRRMAEYERCLERLGLERPQAEVAQIRGLCSGRQWPEQTTIQALPRPGTPALDSVPDSYRSQWVFMPEVLPAALEEVEPGINWVGLGAAGYQFDPQLMWKLFVLGATVAQQRCTEFNDLLGWKLVDPQRHTNRCGDVEALKAALAPLRLKVKNACWLRENKLRDCPR